MKSKHAVLLVIALAFLKPTLACSCGPPVYDFFETIHSESQVGIVRLDSLRITTDSITGNQTEYATCTLIESFNFSDNTDGDTITIFAGNWSELCMLPPSMFSVGDTLVVGLQTDFETQDSLLLYYIPHCYEPYIEIENGLGNGLTLFEIEQRAQGVINSVPGDWVYDLKILPNPCSQFIKLQTSFEKADYEVSNALGQVLLQSRLVRGESIDVSMLQSGVYFVTVISDDRRQTLKLLKE